MYEHHGNAAGVEGLIQDQLAGNALGWGEELQRAEIPDGGLAQGVGALGREIGLQRHLPIADGNGGPIQGRVELQRTNVLTRGEFGQGSGAAQEQGRRCGGADSEFGVQWSDANQRRADARFTVAHAQAADAELIRKQDLLELAEPRRQLVLGKL